MSADNSVARSESDAGPLSGAAGFAIPPELSAQYEVRVVEAAGGERRAGLFRPGNRETPAIEIGDNRIIARSEDAATIASLVTIAQHNGWERIDVDGSLEFRKAVWSAATREGLTVSGYEPIFTELERVEALRQGRSQHRAREADGQATPAGQIDPQAVAIPVQSAETERDAAGLGRSASAGATELSEQGRRREREDLAELFLHGATELVAADPRLTNAVRAQSAMEEHIAEVFQGDPGQLAVASVESRQMISDVLRRGLDVSVREPTPVRQIEPMQTRPDLER